MKIFLNLISLAIGIATLVKHYNRVAKSKDEAGNTQIAISIGKHDSKKSVEETE